MKSLGFPSETLTPRKYHPVQFRLLSIPLDSSYALEEPMKPQRILTLLLVCPLAGCALKEVRSKSEGGVEYRHSGSTRHESQRYAVKQGVELRWDKGVTTAVKYRRRDINDGSGDHDDGVWFEIGFPIWKAQDEPNGPSKRIVGLEQRVAALERELERTHAPEP